jgi:phosphoribosyl 1,2-cyclic phosphodiesterase
MTAFPKTGLRRAQTLIILKLPAVHWGVDAMIITFYGVRGSIPSPGPDTAKYGGNTSCVHIELENGQLLVLDAGTGIRQLGKRLISQDTTINILLSHGHWDHIQGYPFFEPIYQAGRHIRVFTSSEGNHGQICSLFDQIDGASFPLHANELPSRAECINEYAETVLADENINIRRAQLNHPGGGSAYRIEEDGASCAYITDNELEPPEKPSTGYDQWVAFCQGVDVLIHDAQYLETDMPHKHGWGHSLVSQVRQLAVDAEVGCLAMFHHDADRTDTEIDFIQKENDSFFHGQRAPARSVCAAENMQIRLTGRHDRRTVIDVS